MKGGTRRLDCSSPRLHRLRCVLGVSSSRSNWHAHGTAPERRALTYAPAHRARPPGTASPAPPHTAPAAALPQRPHATCLPARRRGRPPARPRCAACPPPAAASRWRGASVGRSIFSASSRARSRSCLACPVNLIPCLHFPHLLLPHLFMAACRRSSSSALRPTSPTAAAAAPASRRCLAASAPLMGGPSRPGAPVARGFRQRLARVRHVCGAGRL